MVVRWMSLHEDSFLTRVIRHWIACVVRPRSKRVNRWVEESMLGLEPGFGCVIWRLTAPSRFPEGL